MGFVNINFIFANIFSCSDTSNEDLDIIYKTIEKENDYDIIFSIILMKFINWTFDFGLLYKHTPHLQLLKTIKILIIM